VESTHKTIFNEEQFEADGNMGGTGTEACGRCAMTSVVDTTQDDRDESEQRERDPFAAGSIEVSDAEARRVSPAAWLGGLKRRLDEFATGLTYGRR
jgi:hypothetical protein